MVDGGYVWHINQSYGSKDGHIIFNNLLSSRAKDANIVENITKQSTTLATNKPLH